MLEFISLMPVTLASLRKAKELTQGEVGRQLANLLNQKIGPSYAQKKIARFETGAAAPTDRELEALASILKTEVAVVRELVSKAPQEVVAVVDQAAARGRSFMANCMLGRPRPVPIPESYQAFRTAIDEHNFSLAVFLPYPSTVVVPNPTRQISNLVGYYTRVINDVMEANREFKNSIRKNPQSIALYAPRPELLQTSAILIPPVLRQYTLMIQQSDPPTGSLKKSLHVWTPGKDVDIGRPVRATGTYSLHDQIDAWESFFGEVIPHWIEHNELISEDAYWKRIR